MVQELPIMYYQVGIGAQHFLGVIQLAPGGTPYAHIYQKAPVTWPHSP